MANLSNLERYQRIAWAYDLLDFPFEYGRYRKIRPQMFRSLSGRVLDAGVGMGRNFPYYPPADEVVGIDVSSAMLARAEHRRHTAATAVESRQMDVTRLDFQTADLTLSWLHSCSARCPTRTIAAGRYSQACSVLT
jgi:demethylmenaquinone methyltransferase/2-methoxy-6-polyprenyl-1,4-benzoquinol methylase